MTAPTIHLNGTSREELIRQYEVVSDAARALESALFGAYPNARDYYPQGPEAFSLAVKEHEARIASVGVILAEITALWEAAES